MSEWGLAITIHYVMYLPKYMVIVCHKCKYVLCLHTRSIQKHFCSTYKFTMTVIRKSISKYIKELFLNEIQNMVVRQNNTVEPLSEVELSKGFECDTCGYLSKAVKIIWDHCYKLHSYVRLKNIQWSQWYIQMFFLNHEFQYFMVNVSHANDVQVNKQDDHNLFHEYEFISRINLGFQKFSGYGILSWGFWRQISGSKSWMHCISFNARNPGFPVSSIYVHFWGNWGLGHP